MAGASAACTCGRSVTKSCAMWNERYGVPMANTLLRPTISSVPGSCPAQYGSVWLFGFQTAPTFTHQGCTGLRDAPRGPMQYTSATFNPSAEAAASEID